MVATRNMPERNLFNRMERWRSEGNVLAGVKLNEPEKVIGRNIAGRNLQEQAMALMRAKMPAKEKADAVERVCSRWEAGCRNASLQEVAKLAMQLDVLISYAKQTQNAAVVEAVSACRERVVADLNEKSRMAETSGRMRSMPLGPALDTDASLSRMEATERLFEAAKNGDRKGVLRALDDGADPVAKDPKGKTPMEYAMGDDVYDSLAVPKHPKVVEVLQPYVLQGKAKMNKKLLKAVWNGDEQETERLLKAGADPNARTPDGMNAVDLAEFEEYQADGVLTKPAYPKVADVLRRFGGHARNKVKKPYQKPPSSGQDDGRNLQERWGVPAPPRGDTWDADV